MDPVSVEDSFMGMLGAGWGGRVLWRLSQQTEPPLGMQKGLDAVLGVFC